MTLLINNDVTARVLDMGEAVAAMENALLQHARGQATFQPRVDLWSPTAKDGDYYRWGHLLGAMADPPTLALRFKSDILKWTDYSGVKTEEWFCMEPGRYCGFIILIDTSNGEIIGLLNDGVLQHVRVGATAGVGAKYLARKDACVLGVLGSGGMARTYTEALAVARELQEVRVYSPTPKNREAFAEEMGEKLGIRVVPCDSAASALKDVDMVATCTDSRVPVYTADMLKLHRPGVFLVRCRYDEMDDATFEAVDKVFVNATGAYTDLVIGTEEERARRPTDSAYRRRYKTTSYGMLADVIAGKIEGRTSDGETIFYHNTSAGLQFAAIGRLVYERARAARLGMPIPIDWFTQDIRN
ncbi:ornithine cyclodeaminase family protein [Propylenella binzhouense]|uniref:Ornithine cyclodeaminase family protein n=1 Tax=Propylenella binzhouense TaxID=2555902 RepID=A0A964WST0_9HYPH|nr:ornithine cyclodeaminase family protein [Propylenella binzhouense]MYZ47120.1 ornithine cyclodeaminase family protein [Propylenella binzhouense]